MTKSKNSNFLFNFIAPVYGLFYKSQKQNYIKVINSVKDIIDISTYKNIIDIGCGTGALCSALLEYNLDVTGLEPAKKMLRIGMKKKENQNIKFISGSTDKGLNFEKKSFDISIASYVAHGLKKSARVKLYSEMSSVTKDFVILHDYNQNRNIITSIVEFAERGDYFNFIKTVEEELNENFESVKVVNVGKRAAWYICKPKAD